ncbi:hypothetical protein [Bacillus alkalicellulosilyticus]|uniref:hypothetical protein n=1 Tax=Alkalihalobacterium alkalicellulosilyticum TaxID=1912214 RepID=UPI000997C87F|nr:hypothetical protein [Bacillus alkalicellulosilyticus]
MHTIVIQYQEQPQDWHLVEPFFYKVRSAGKLAFFGYEQATAENLYDEMSHYLSQQRISIWQAVVLLTVPTTGQRLTTKIAGLKEQWFSKFSDQDLMPDSVTFILLDTLKRDSSYSPEDKGYHPVWQLDNFGYFKFEDYVEHNQNMFTQTELHELDDAWGTQIKIQEAGLLDKPDTSFLQLIEEKQQRVIDKLLIFTELKGIQSVQYQGEAEVLSPEQLDEIKELFTRQLRALVTPPLVSDLHHFSPSQLLEKILKERLALASAISDYRIVRQVSSVYSVEKRTKALVSVALFINALATSEECTEQIPKGSTYELEMIFHPETLSLMLANYQATLQAAAYKIDSKLMDRQVVLQNRYEDVKVQPHTADPLAEVNIEEPLFKIRKHRTYREDWKKYLAEVEEKLKEREEQMMKEAKKGAKQLAILKRREPVKEEEALEIQDYVVELKEKVEHIYRELVTLKPEVYDERKEWKEKTEEHDFWMDLHVKASPTKKQVAIALGLSGLFLLGPHLYTMDWSTVEGQWFDYTAVPLLITGAIFTLGYVVKQQMTAPIETIVNKSRQKKRELFERQQKKHGLYNRYLNKLYELYRTRQQLFLVEQEFNQQRQENYLYRYHQSQLIEYKQASEQLIFNLGVNKHVRPQSFIDFFEDKFRLEDDMYKNPIYSPFDCLLDKVNQNHQFIVQIGQSERAYSAGHLSALDRLKFTKDQVYKL